MKEKNKKSKWYNSNLLFSHNAFCNFVMSSRGPGKTYDGKDRMINNFLEKGEESVYIRRTDTEIKDVKDTFWADIKNKYPNHEFTVEGYEGFIDGKVAVYFIPLSTSLKKKSKPLPNVTLIMYDEYVVPQGTNMRYLKDEMFFFFELLFSIIRDRDNVKVYICANAISYVNPFFTYYQIEPDPKKRFQKFNDNTICLELFKSDTYKEEILKTGFGKFIKNTPYSNYALDNEVYEDKEDFIKPNRSGNYAWVSAFKSNKYEIGVWLSLETGEYYIDNKIEKNSKDKFAIKATDVEVGYTYIRSVTIRNWRIRNVKQAYGQGNLYFANQEVKRFFQDYVINFL